MVQSKNDKNDENKMKLEKMKTETFSRLPFTLSSQMYSRYVLIYLSIYQESRYVRLSTYSYR